MNEEKVDMCPKCGNEMKRRKDLADHAPSSMRVRKSEDWVGDKVISFECQNGGYIELYNEKNLERKKS